ncbi:MAG: DUF1622 domain-containing protein [bacterium]|nr:DUF1622 domain-containing protein [bacterium]
MEESTYTSVMLQVAQGFELVAAITLIIGLVLAFVLSLRTYLRTRNGAGSYRILRQTFGGVILLGLEILVAGDLIRTVAVEPTFENVAVLGIIVLIRTFLSFSLEIEIDGVPPWRRGLVSGATVVRNAARNAADQSPESREAP